MLASAQQLVLQGDVGHCALEVVVGATRRREEALRTCWRRRLAVVLARHASQAGQALRATGLWVGSQAVVTELPPRQNVSWPAVRHGQRQLRQLQVLVQLSLDHLRRGFFLTFLRVSAARVSARVNKVAMPAEGGRTEPAGVSWPETQSTQEYSRVLHYSTPGRLLLN